MAGRFDLSPEIEETFRILYGREPKSGTWQDLYRKEFYLIQKDLFRMYVATARAGASCDQPALYAFLVYEERLHVNNPKQVHAIGQDGALKMLQACSSIKEKCGAEYRRILEEKQAAKREKEELAEKARRQAQKPAIGDIF